MGQKLFEIAVAGCVAGAAALYVLVEDSGPARQLSRQWARDYGVADWASRLVADAVIGPRDAALAPHSTPPTVLSHPLAATWMVVGNLAMPESDGGVTSHTYRVKVQRLCDWIAEPACWRIDDLELDGGPVALEDSELDDSELQVSEPADDVPIRVAAAAESAPASAPTPTPGMVKPAPELPSAPPQADAQPPVKPAPELLAAALVAADTVKPTPERVSEPPPAAATDAPPAPAVPADTASIDEPDEPGDTAVQQAAVPSDRAAAPQDASDGDADDTAAREEEPLYVWTDPAMMIPIQRQLKARGFKIGTIDGILGPRTREAIESYQRQHGLPPDGTPSAALLRHMTGQQTATASSAPQAARTAAAPQTVPEGAVPPPPQLGAASSAAQTSGVEPAAPVDGAALLQGIQLRLEQLGYVVDQPYGTMGWHTREAISTYQWRYGMPIDGLPSAALLTHLEQHTGG